MQGTHLEFEPQLSIQKCESILFYLLAELFRGFLCSFSYWLDEKLAFSRSFWKRSDPSGGFFKR